MHAREDDQCYKGGGPHRLRFFGKMRLMPCKMSNSAEKKTWSGELKRANKCSPLLSLPLSPTLAHQMICWAFGNSDYIRFNDLWHRCRIFRDNAMTIATRSEHVQRHVDQLFIIDGICGFGHLRTGGLLENHLRCCSNGSHSCQTEYFFVRTAPTSSQ